MAALRIRTGIDLVYLPRLRAFLADGAFLRRAFQPAELLDPRPEHLAGLFAAKEACFKALDSQPRWLDVTVEMGEGRPRLRLSPGLTPPDLISLDLSITHERDYAVAVVVVLLGERATDGVR